MKPPNLAYGLDDAPPPWITLVLGFQHLSIVAISLILPVLVVRTMGGNTAQATFMVSMSMLAAGLAVLAQSLRRGPMGSGFLCPAVSGPSFLSATILAAKLGGLPLIFGMTFFAGLVEAVFSRVIKRLRVLFPAEVTGLIVAMVGITVIKLAGANFLGLKDAGTAARGADIMVAVFTLAVMVGLNVWSKGRLKLFCTLIGMALGYGAASAMGVLRAEHWAVMSRSAWAAFPLTDHPGWAFDWSMALPFAIAIICSSLKSVGDITTCQKINDTGWKRPDMDNISKGILADAFGSVAAGALGGMGQSTSSSNVGLSIATGATSRVIALSTGGLLIFLAFCPKLASVFAIMPPPVMGATLIFALSFMVVAGFNIVMSRMIDARKTFVIGLSVILGLMVDMLPGAFDGLPQWLHPVFASSLSAATIAAVALNLVFRIGVRSTADLELSPGENYPERVFAFFDRQGGAWAARPEVVNRARDAVNEIAEAVLGDGDGSLSARAGFDEYRLDVRLTWTGRALDFPEDRPTKGEVLADAEAGRRLSGFLARQFADQLDIRRDGEANTVTLRFNH